MVKWLNYTASDGPYSYTDNRTGGVYIFNRFGKSPEQKAKGTPVPNEVAERLLKRGEFRLVTETEWHVQRRTDKENAMQNEYLEKIPSDVRDLIVRKMAENAKAGGKK